MREDALLLWVRSIGLFFGLVALGLLASGGSAWASARPHLKLAWLDPSGAAPGLQRDAIAEASALLGEMGVEAEWQELRAGDDLEGIDVLVVMSNRRSGRNPRGAVMGSVSYQSGQASRGAWVSVPEVTGTLGMDARPGAWWAEQRRTLARAIGRVAAHEVVHTLAPQREHAASGLMSAALGAGDLTRARLAVDPLTRSVVRDVVEQRGLGLLATHPEAPEAAACDCPTSAATM
jgi:hypothetical protein